MCLLSSTVSGRRFICRAQYDTLTYTQDAALTFSQTSVPEYRLSINSLIHKLIRKPITDASVTRDIAAAWRMRLKFDDANLGEYSNLSVQGHRHWC